MLIYSNADDKNSIFIKDNGKDLNNLSTLYDI
jgi:hypothetical protein